MTGGHIFIQPKTPGQSLKDFAHELFRWLHIPRFEEVRGNRDWDTISYCSRAAGIEIGVSENPKKTYMVGRCLENYPFLLTMQIEGTKLANDYLMQHAHTLAWRLSREGFRCFIAKSFIDVSGEADRMIYQPD